MKIIDINNKIKFKISSLRPKEALLVTQVSLSLVLSILSNIGTYNDTPDATADYVFVSSIFTKKTVNEVESIINMCKASNTPLILHSVTNPLTTSQKASINNLQRIGLKRWRPQ